jgi:hypothetical protein
MIEEQRYLDSKNMIYNMDTTKRTDDTIAMRETEAYKKLRSGKVVASSVEPGVAVSDAERSRALLKEQQLMDIEDVRASNAMARGKGARGTGASNTNSSRRSCPSTVTHLTNLNVTSRKNTKQKTDSNKMVDPYLLRLLQVDEVAADRSKGIAWGTTKTATMGTMGTMGTNKSGSTEFRVPELPTKRTASPEKDGRKARELPPLMPTKPPASPKTAVTPAPALNPSPLVIPVPVTSPYHPAKMVLPQAPVTVSQPSSNPATGDIQASNSLEKTKTTNPSTQPDMDKDAKVSASHPRWDFMDTKSVLGEDVFDTLKTSVVQHQKEYLEQLFDLHRAIAVQRLLVRHSSDQKTLVKEYQKEEGRAKKALQKAGLCFGTTEWHRGLHPDSQFAALSSDDGTDADLSGDVGTGSDVGASGSGGNGKSGNGSGGGSTSQFVPNIAAGQVSVPGIPGNGGVQRAAPSGASNSPMIGVAGPWGPAFGVNVGNMQGMAPGLIDVPGMVYAPHSNTPYGTDPMMWWYQEYYNRMGAAQQQQQPGVARGGRVHRASASHAAGNTAGNMVGTTNPSSNATGTDGIANNSTARGMPPPLAAHVRTAQFPGVFKWWQDPKMAFGAPIIPKDVLKRAKQGVTCREGTEVESAPPSEEITDAEEAREELPAESARRQDYTQKKKKKKKKKTSENTESKEGIAGEVEGKDASLIVKQATKKRRARKRLLKDPVAAASSGTSGPLPHHSSEGVLPVPAPDSNSKDELVGNVAKLLMSISTHEAGSGSTRGTRSRRKSSRKSSM